MYADVRDLGAARLVADLGFLPDWIVGSPPCQDASCANAGGRGVDGERTGLFFEAVRLIGECRPAWTVLENVPGLRTRGADRVLAELEVLGYACWPLVVGAWHAGAPHRRNRVWIIAADAALGTGPAVASRLVENAAAGPARRGPDVTAAGDALGAGLALGKGVGSDACPQLAAIERAVGAAGLAWNGGPARHLRMADGVPAGVARKCIAAYGDAVVPQITEAIARAILSIDRVPA
jgi:DNA (cytosine-5)-methyltransferase 1